MAASSALLFFLPTAPTDPSITIDAKATVQTSEIVSYQTYMGVVDIHACTTSKSAIDGGIFRRAVYTTLLQRASKILDTSAFQVPTRICDDVRVKVYYIHLADVTSYRLGGGGGGGGATGRLPPPLRNGREHEVSMFELMGGARRSQRLARGMRSKK